MIRIQGLTKDFPLSGKKADSRTDMRTENGKTFYRAVDGLSLHIEKGEIFGLLGANGAGKTTTLRLLATMLRPTAGSAEIAGFDIVRQSESVRKSIGILFGGDTGLYDRLTARENIAYFGRLYDMTEEQIAARTEELCQIFDLTRYIDARCGTFSRGMKQKTAFARSIIHSPQVMLFDEPTAGLDISAALEVQHFISACKQEGKTVILSSHNMTEVERLCDRIGIIEHGKLLACGTQQQLLETYGCSDLEQVFIMLTEGAKK